MKEKRVKKEKAQRQKKKRKGRGEGEEEEENAGHRGSVRVKELIERVMTSEAFQIGYSVR